MFSFKDIRDRMISRISDNMDKREGSVIYDATMPVALGLEDCYDELEQYRANTFLLTATNDALDLKGSDYALDRQQATKALRIANTYNPKGELVNVVVNTRYAIAEQDATFILKSYESVGVAILECEQDGVIGNEYIGELLPLTTVVNLGKIEIVGTKQPAQDTEDDDTYRIRIQRRLSKNAFAGNKAAYLEALSEIEGVGNAMIFSAKPRAGEVTLSIVDRQNNPISEDFQLVIKNIFDPDDEEDGIGLAPINATVRVSTPINVQVDISATLVLTSIDFAQAQPLIENALSDYFAKLRETWGQADIIYVYLSRIIQAILTIDGISNVTNVTLNGNGNDVILMNNYIEQQTPMLGVVALRI